MGPQPVDANPLGAGAPKGRRRLSLAPLGLREKEEKREGLEVHGFPPRWGVHPWLSAHGPVGAGEPLRAFGALRVGEGALGGL